MDERRKRNNTKKTTKSGSTGGKYIGLIIDAIGKLKHRGGASRQAIKSYLEGEKIEVLPTPFRLALRRGVESGVLLQTGHSFRVGSKVAARKPKAKSTSTTMKKISSKKAPSSAKKASSTKAKKPATKKTKKSTTKKTTATKKKSTGKKTTGGKKKSAKKTTTKATSS